MLTSPYEWKILEWDEHSGSKASGSRYTASKWKLENTYREVNYFLEEGENFKKKHADGYVQR